MKMSKIKAEKLWEWLLKPVFLDTLYNVTTNPIFFANKVLEGVKILFNDLRATCKGTVFQTFTVDSAASADTWYLELM